MGSNILHPLQICQADALKPNKALMKSSHKLTRRVSCFLQGFGATAVSGSLGSSG